MWSQYYQASLSKLLRESILLLCSENVPFQDKLEIDGIICISTTADQKQIVVKVHEVVENPKDRSPVPNRAFNYNSCSTEPEDEEIFTIESQDHQRSTDGDQSVDSVISSHCEIAVAVENGTSVEYTVTGPAVPQHLQDNDTSEEECGEGLPSRHSHLPCRNIVPSHRWLTDSRQGLTDGGGDSSSGEQEDALTRHQGHYPCRLCANHFTSFSALSAHNYDVHCRFTCHQCLNTFSMMCNLKRHERLHVGGKPYTCDQCGKGFSRNSDLRIHYLKLHRYADPNSGQSGGHQEKRESREHSQHHKKIGKSVGLGDILSKLASKQLQKLRERDQTVEDRITRPKGVHQYTQDDSTFLPKSEPDENWIGLKQQVNDSGKCVELERKDMQSDLIPTPLPTPMFSRSILKPSVYVNSISKESSKKVIHIYPTCNSSSGGHLEEAPLSKKMKYDPTQLPSPSELNGADQQAQQYGAASTVHGLSFGRIVFPERALVKTESQENDGLRGRGCGAVEHGLTSLPFLTYSGQQKVSAEMWPQSEVRTPSTSPMPPSPLASSASSSPTRIRTPPLKGPKEEQVDLPPALIALDRRYWCHLCKSYWENFSGYEQHHVSQHLRYPCQFCDQTFSNKNNRSRHIRSHTGQKEHICTDCGKSFSRSDTLKEHQIIHTDGYLGDQCSHCHTIIKKKAELLSHIKKCSQRQRGRHSASASPTSFSEGTPTDVMNLMKPITASWPEPAELSAQAVFLTGSDPNAHAGS